MMYIKLTNNQPEPYSLRLWRLDNSGVSLPESPSEELLASYDVYPCTLKPRPDVGLGQVAKQNATASLENGQWVIDWIIEDIPATSDMVKQEAQRRILEILPEWKQRNLTARAAELAMIGQVNWTAEQQAEWDAGQALWDQIKAIRIMSDTLEAMDPIPSDYQDDKYWR